MKDNTCPICEKEMEPDVKEEYEEGDILFCFECGITNDSPSYHQAILRNKEVRNEYRQYIEKDNWYD